MGKSTAQKCYPRSLLRYSTWCSTCRRRYRMRTLSVSGSMNRLWTTSELSCRITVSTWPAANNDNCSIRWSCWWLSTVNSPTWLCSAVNHCGAESIIFIDRAAHSSLFVQLQPNSVNVPGYCFCSVAVAVAVQSSSDILFSTGVGYLQVGWFL